MNQFSSSTFFICPVCKQVFDSIFLKGKGRGNHLKYCSAKCRNKAKANRLGKRWSQHDKDWQRNNKLNLNGKRVLVRKRPFQGKCELCGKVIEGKEQPHWHHWNDDQPELGIWVDARCHRLCEAIDDYDPKLWDLYLKKKREINNGKI